jgi:hypothetical protein
MGTAGAIAEKFLKQKYGVEIVSTSNTFANCCHALLAADMLY